MSQYLIEQIAETPNIAVKTHSSVIEAKGETSLEALTIHNSLTGETQTVPGTSLFIFIGAVPRTEWLDGVIARDDRDPFLLETNIPGVFAVGDVRHGSVKRVASGVGEGSICVQFVHRYLSNVL
jgi:thioredoxin reductase (NADPH)